MAFNVAADAYDSFMGRYSVQLGPQMADLAGIEAGQRVLDVGCGPRALTAGLLQRGAGVPAVHPSPQVGAAAQERYPAADVRPATAEHPTFEEWWLPFTLGVGPAGEYYQRLEPTRQRELEQRLREQLPEPVTLETRAWAARGAL